MKKIKESGKIERIRKSLEVLESENAGEFNMIIGLFAIMHDTTGLLATVFDKEKIKEWKNLWQTGTKSSCYLRFAGDFEKGFALQMNYLSSIHEQLIIENNVFSEVIKKNYEQINALLNQKNMITKKVGPLLEKEEELRKNEKELEVLLSKRSELEGIKEKISGYDIDELKRDVAEKEKMKFVYETEFKPLQKKQIELQCSLTELTEANKNLPDIIELLEKSHGEEYLKLTKSIPLWIEKIKNQGDTREGENKKVLERLEEEGKRLRETEANVQKHFDEFREILSLRKIGDSILRAHFEANKTIGDRSFKSLSKMPEEYPDQNASIPLPEMQKTLSILNVTIQEDLTKYDTCLKQMQESIQKIASEFKPMRIGG